MASSAKDRSQCWHVFSYFGMFWLLRMMMSVEFVSSFQKCGRSANSVTPCPCEGSWDPAFRRWCSSESHGKSWQGGNLRALSRFANPRATHSRYLLQMAMAIGDRKAERHHCSAHSTKFNEMICTYLITYSQSCLFVATRQMFHWSNDIHKRLLKKTPKTWYTKSLSLTYLFVFLWGKDGKGRHGRP